MIRQKKTANTEKKDKESQRNGELLSLILEKSEIFADLTPVFSMNKTLLFCFTNEVTSLC